MTERISQILAKSSLAEANAQEIISLGFLQRMTRQHPPKILSGKEWHSRLELAFSGKSTLPASAIQL